jgi:hypothetical protein
MCCAAEDEVNRREALFGQKNHNPYRGAPTARAVCRAS